MKHTFTNTVTINGLTCQKIDYLSYSSSCNYGPNSLGGSYYTYFNNNVVYLIAPVSNNFDTLFNFNATIGSKWSLTPKSYTNCSKSKVLVTDTGHNVIQGLSLKWFKVSITAYNAFNSTPWILNDTIYERLGCTQIYFFNNNETCITVIDGAVFGGPLRCYSDTQIINYNRYSGACNYFVPLVAGVKENSSSSNFNVYPNPSNSLINVELSRSSSRSATTFKIINTLGQIIQTTNIQQQTTALDISELQNGIYFLQVFDAEKLIGTRKIIKE